MPIHYHGDYQAEQDLEWSKGSAGGKLVTLPSWTIYRKIRPKTEAPYLTPVGRYKNEHAALTALRRKPNNHD